MAAATQTLPTEIDEGGAFQFQGTKLLLTYPTHVDKRLCVNQISAAVGGANGAADFKFIRCAHETGMSQGVAYAHTHVLINFGKVWRCRSSRRLDLTVGDQTLHPNWRPVKTPTHWRNATEYIAKEDPENQDLIAVRCLARDIWDCSTAAEALERFAKTPSDAPGILTMYAAKPRDVDVDDDVEPDYPWQMEIRALIETKPSASAIHWIFDPRGQNGKTTLTRFLASRKAAYMCKHSGGSINFATLVQSAIAAGWDQRCWIFDLSRSTEDNAIYGPIEDIKDGMVTATKYRGESIVINRPHVIVMANFLPKLMALSMDRWRIFQIVGRSLIRLSAYKLLAHPEYGHCSRTQSDAPDIAHVLEDPKDAPARGKTRSVSGGASGIPTEGNPSIGGGLTLNKASAPVPDLESVFNELLDPEPGSPE